MGRPSKYSVALTTDLCRRMAEEGQTLHEICRSDGMPHRVTVLRWLEKHEEFRTQYTRARSELLDYWADEIIKIAEDGSNDYMDRRLRNGTIQNVVNREVVERSRLRVDTRKWLMSKLAPRKYGEFQKIEQNVNISVSYVELLRDMGAGESNRPTLEIGPAAIRDASPVGNA